MTEESGISVATHNARGIQIDTREKMGLYPMTTDTMSPQRAVTISVM